MNYGEKIISKYSTKKEPEGIIAMLMWLIVLLVIFMSISWGFGLLQYIQKEMRMMAYCAAVDDICIFENGEYTDIKFCKYIDKCLPLNKK